MPDPPYSAHAHSPLVRRVLLQWTLTLQLLLLFRPRAALAAEIGGGENPVATLPATLGDITPPMVVEGDHITVPNGSPHPHQAEAAFRFSCAQVPCSH